MESNKLTIVIVTYKSEEKIFSCLDSIPKNVPIIIIENSNNQDFKKQIKNRHPNIECILTGSNKGYAVANNIGCKIDKKKKNITMYNPIIPNLLCLKRVQFFFNAFLLICFEISF